MGYVGLYGGMLLGLLGWYFGRRAASKNRGLDEVHHYIWSKAKTTSWYCTLAAIYIFLMLETSGVHIRMMPALSILLLVHLSSWGISGAIFSKRMTAQPDEVESTAKSQLKPSLYIGIPFLILFTIVSAFTGNWKFLLFAFPPVLLTISIAFQNDRRNSKK